jgi:hypothetical protein
MKDFLKNAVHQALYIVSSSEKVNLSKEEFAKKFFLNSTQSV